MKIHQCYGNISVRAERVRLLDLYGS